MQHYKHVFLNGTSAHHDMILTITGTHIIIYAIQKQIVAMCATNTGAHGHNLTPKHVDSSSQLATLPPAPSS